MSSSSVWMDKLCCNKTTEAGADEVYILIAGTCTTNPSKKVAARLPADAAKQSAGHWDMNDGNQPWDNPNGDSHCITNRNLLTIANNVTYYDTLDISQGETWELILVFMEEDGGTSKPYMDVIYQALQTIDNPYAKGVATFLQTLNNLGFFLTDTDDQIGSIGLRITWDNNTLSFQWTPKENVAQFDVNPTNPHKFHVNMNGAGSQYEAWFDIHSSPIK